ncbi:hypothetical protein AB0F17_14715 [Nonomuraea sp. NPDC026600]
MITYLTGDATDPAGNEPRIICHVFLRAITVSQACSVVTRL